MPIFLAWRHQSALFDHLELFEWKSPASLSGSEPESVPTAGVSTEFFSMLGVHPSLGRDFRPEEGRPGGPHVVILSDGLWRRRFGGNPNVLGQTLTLDGESYVVVGVLPRGFEFPLHGAPNAGLWLPIQLPGSSNNPSNGGLLCLGLLKSGVTPALAEAALTRPLSELRLEFPSMFTPGERAHLVPFRDFVTSLAGSAPLLLFGAVGLVLLLACVNVANLALARSATRQREMAIRAAIGASRGRIIRQLLTESVLLAGLGGALGVLACYGSFDLIVALVPAYLSHVGEFRIDASVLVFGFLISILTGIVFGLAPALAASRVDPNASLKEADPHAGSGGQGRFRRALAASEVAISLVLLIGAALALESLARLTHIQPGFDAANSLTFYVSLPDKKYDTPAKKAAFFEQALSRISALPGVEQAALANSLPLTGGPDLLFSIEGGAASPRPTEDLDANLRVISPDYLGALRIPLRRGRGFTSSDNAAAAPVVVINQAMAQAVWPGRDPIGQRIWIGKPMGPAESEPAPRAIIGVVGDVRESSLAEPPEPTMYIPYAQWLHADGGYFIIRTAGAPLLSIPDAGAALRAVDPDLPLIAARSMDDVLSGSMSDWRFDAILLGTFGALALFIATIGVYGVISYSVAQRTREIGIRMALGALRKDVLGLVLWQGVRLALFGVAVGVAASLALTRLLSSLLFGVSATDPATFAGVAIALMIVALAACYIPARRATRVDPMVALRHE